MRVCCNDENMQRKVVFIRFFNCPQDPVLESTIVRASIVLSLNT